MAELNLYYAHRLPVLARNLAAALKPRLHERASLFNPVDIIVPNKTMQSYLEQEIARQLGVTPNLRFHLLRSFLADKLSPAPSDHRDPVPRILGADVLQHILIDVLHAAHANPLPDCEPLSAYLDVKDAKAQPNEAARELRLYQISEELARIFIEYGFSRSASVLDSTMEAAPLLVKWSRDELQDPKDSIEKWQKALWRHIFGPGGVLDDINARAKTVGDAPYMTLAEAFIAFKDAPAAHMPERVYMVGFPYIARLFIEGIQLLSGHSDVHVYALTPAQKWADSSSAELTETDHPLLHQWATAGEIHAKMWAQTGARIRRVEAAATEDTTLLHALQNDIIAGSAAPHSAPNLTESREGIRFFECPSIAREVDAVTNEIWTLLKEDDDLRPDEIAVLIAGSDQESYQLQIGEAFRSFHRLPFNEVGLPATSGGRVLDAAKLLLRLPFGRFRRSELLKLLVHPNLRGRGEDIDADQWAQWCDKLGILYGASRTEQADSYLGLDYEVGEDRDYQWDLYNWDQGFRRVVLGNFLSGERSGVNALFRMGRSDYQPLEIGESASSATSNFVALASSLMADARWLCGSDGAPTQRNATEWAAIVEDYFRTYLQVSAEAEEDATDRRREDARNLSAVYRALRKIGRSCPIEGKISYRIFNEFARDAIENLRQDGTHYLCGGVVVSTLLAARAIPFKHIFVVGLGEGQFPNPEIRNTLDLRQGAPQLGDLKPADRDRYAFLETLLAAGQGVTLSWVAREATTGDALNASSVVNELRWVLESRFKVAASHATGTDTLTVIQPLRRYDAALFGSKNAGSNLSPSMHPVAVQEHCVMALREALSGANQGQKPRAIPTLDAIRREANPNFLTPALREVLHLPILPSETGEASDMKSPAEAKDESPLQKQRRVRISLSKLRNFLESPLQAAASVQLGLRDDEEDIFANEREPLEANRLYTAIALRKVATRALAIGADRDALEEIYNKTLLPEMILRAQLPSGHFATSNRDSHLKLLDAWWQNFGVLNIAPPLFPVGIGVDSDECAQNLEAIHFELDLQRNGESEAILVEITGRTELTSACGDTYLSFDTSDGTKPRGKYIARSFMSWVAATAAGRDHPPTTRLMVDNSHKLTTKTAPNFSVDAPPWSQEEARQYLKGLVTSLLSEDHDYLLPIEFAADKNKMTPKDCTRESLQEWLDDKLSGDFVSISSQYGPIKDYMRFEAPRDTNIAARLDARFPFFSWSDK